MAWQEYGKSLVPVRYNIVIPNYSSLPYKEEEENKRDADAIINDLLEMWGDLRGWWLSGAVAVSAVTQTYPRQHTNIDIALENDANLLEEMVERAKSCFLFPFRRTISFKTSTKSKDKHEIYILASPKVMAKNLKKDKNYMLRKVDQDGAITPKNTPTNVVRLYFHKWCDDNDSFLSIEDGMEIPRRYLSFEHREGRIIASESRKMILAVDLHYMLDLHREALLKLNPSFKARIGKHLQEIERIEGYLKAHQNYLHLREPIHQS